MKMHGSTLDLIEKTVWKGLLNSLQILTSLWSVHLEMSIFNYGVLVGEVFQSSRNDQSKKGFLNIVDWTGLVALLSSKASSLS